MSSSCGKRGLGFRTLNIHPASFAVHVERHRDSPAFAGHRSGATTSQATVPNPATWQMRHCHNGLIRFLNLGYPLTATAKPLGCISCQVWLAVDSCTGLWETEPTSVIQQKLRLLKVEPSHNYRGSPKSSAEVVGQNFECSTPTLFLHLFLVMFFQRSHAKSRRFRDGPRQALQPSPGSKESPLPPLRGRPGGR